MCFGIKRGLIATRALANIPVPRVCVYTWVMFLIIGVVLRFSRMGKIRQALARLPPHILAAAAALSG